MVEARKADKSAPDPRGTAPALVRAPAPSLPTGGGAIRGIGETFTANPVTGTGTFRVPIATSPGRAGFHPELALAYDSGAGNGPFGLGWHLSVPSITRKTEKGLPEYRDADASDIFLLSGADDLVPARDDTGARDIVDTAELRVERYRPRIEGLFARIERRVDKATGAIYWVSITRDNVKSTYGRSAAARLADPERPWRVFSWLLERTEDGKGNVIAYEYQAEDLLGVLPALPEAHRLSGAAPVTNRYLKRVRYGNAAPGDAGSGLFEVVFDYAEHDAATPSPEPPLGQHWPARPDPFSSYRAGFEVRTYRLCRRVLMFHRFPELGAEPCLVSSTDFTYTPDDPVLTKLLAVEHAGYLRPPGTTGYSRKALPPLAFTYAAAEIQTKVESLDPESLRSLPGGVDGRLQQWTDLDGEGIPGLLTDEGSALYYQRNLGAGRLATPRRLSTRPSMSALSGGHQQLVDLAGEGHKDLVQFVPPAAGYHERTADDGWGPFIPFLSQPKIDWDDPNLHFIDLNGDGFDDLLLVKDRELVWYPSQAKRGFGPPRAFTRPSDAEKGPALVFADPTHSIFLADLSGDGLVDLCRITNGSVCYWPNLGHGRFGARVAMAGAPRFDDVASFDARRLRLADIDGSGVADLLYFGRGGPRFWLNQAGNGWGPANELPGFPTAEPPATFALLDLLGTGTGCLVWSSPMPGDRPAIRYIDLLGSKKPHLLVAVDNHLGLTTRLEYTPSTRFYLDDRAAGRPWVTRLHFPVQVLTRVETYDAVRRVRFVSRYRYHHGYYDGTERELRGFGLVEQEDAESFSAPLGAGLFPSLPVTNGEYPLPPVLTKTWFHLGAWREGASISRQFSHEYYAGDVEAWPMPDSTLPGDLSVAEVKEACRALRGQPLRQEIYALDGSPVAGHPYSVTEHAYTVCRVQHAQGEINGVFFAHPRESVEHHYERNPADPRVGQSFTLDVGPYGEVLLSAAVGHPRRAVAGAVPEQQALAITCTESDFAHLLGEVESYRVAVPVETRTYELTLPPQPAGPLLFEALRKSATAAAPLPYEAVPTPHATEKRLIERQRTRYYDGASLPTPLDFGKIDALAIPYESYGLAFTPALLTGIYAGRVTGKVLTDGGYVDLEGTGDAWVPSGRQEPDPKQFYLPVSFVDPFGHTTSVTYDPHALLATDVSTLLGNTVHVDNDYRTLSPAVVTDVNGNRTAAAFDELGMVIATAVMGKAPGAPGYVADEGDTLADPSTTLEYGFYDAATGRPSYAHLSAREVHGPANTRWQESYTYSDGSGHEVMKKARAAPGPIFDAEGNVLGSLASPRWVGTGRTVLNNKGLPIKQYEPFFSTREGYETDEDLVQRGVTPLLQYDALGRLVRTDFPAGTHSRVDFTPWEQATWDENDTLLDAGNLWYAARQPGAVPAPTAEDQRAAALASGHARTPAVTVFDALGRAVRAIADNGGGVRYETRTTLDIEGNPLVVTDARVKPAMTTTFSMLGQKGYEKSIDAGERWMLVNVLGQSFQIWDGMGRAIRTMYDALNRPIELRVQEDGASEVVAERTIYGESQTDPEKSNLRGKVYQQYDGAGLVTHAVHDFKGNLLTASRQVAVDHKAPQLDWGATQTPGLADEAFETTTAYDALNRVESQLTHDESVIRPTYDDGGLLSRVEANVRGAVPSTVFVAGIDYNEKAQRLRVVHGNGVLCAYAYDRRTSRLIGLRSTRGAGGALLQDLTYTHDAVGNISEIHDGAQPDVFRNGELVSATTRYEYDPIYRLTRAEGREHAGQNADVQQDLHGFPLIAAPNPNDPQALRSYIESYVYDEVGNFVSMQHVVPSAPATGASWTRHYQTDTASNQLLRTSVRGDPDDGPYTDQYLSDLHGNLKSMPHLTDIDWDFKNQKRLVDLEGGGTAYYVYDAAGQRVRKVWEHSNLIEERIYVGGFEVYRKWTAGSDTVAPALQEERETLHVMAGAARVAMVETKTVDAGARRAEPAPRLRYQMGNHLGSVALEVDEAGLVISYEEYHPYGTSSYRAVAAGVEVSARRYRYTGKERDEETGLYYHGARYYAPWLGRWTSADPAGLAAGINGFAYCRGRPIVRHDPDGRNDLAGQAAEAVAKGVAYARAGFPGASLGTAAPIATGATAGVVATGGKALLGLSPLGWVAVGAATVLVVGIGLYAWHEYRSRTRQELAQKLDIVRAPGQALPPRSLPGAPGAKVVLPAPQKDDHTISAPPPTHGGDAIEAPAVDRTKQEPMNTVAPRGINIPKVRDAAEVGQEAHRQREAKWTDPEIRQGYKHEVSITLDNGQDVRKDALNEGQKIVVIVKPDTPSGRKAAQKRADLIERQGKKKGYVPVIDLYDPADPAFRPGSPTYIGPK
jgi:RHS repeat-associated protein